MDPGDNETRTSRSSAALSVSSQALVVSAVQSATPSRVMGFLWRSKKMLVCIRDETPSGQSLHELSLEFLSERITVRELIRERVHHEVKEFNRRQSDAVFRVFVQPTESEQVLNGRTTEYRLKHHRQIDWEAQLGRTLYGFTNNP